MTLENPAPDTSDDERAFDAYLERALSGAPPDPGVFAGRASSSLRTALERIYRHARGAGFGDGELPFERLGDYRLIRRLGGGGMGLVFLAAQESLGREVALKIVRPELRGSAVAAERFHREARAVAQLRHPNIVTVFAAGEERGVRYLALELVDGANLDELIKRRELAKIPLARRVRWIAELARALDFAHSHGVIHRDVKPSNVRITGDGRALLLDFGLARTADSNGATLTDGFAGSPSYASPEQIAHDGELDHRTDVYSLGVTLYQCVTGAVPFEGATVEQVFHRILTAEPTPPRKRDATIPRDLDTVVLQAMARDPGRRYASAGAFADDLDAVLELRPIRGRRQSVGERLRGGARRRPVVATAIATGVFALALLVVAFVAQRRLRAAHLREDAQRTVQAAREKIAAYRADRDALRGLTQQVEETRRRQPNNYLPPAEVALLDANESKVEELTRAWEATFYEVLDLLQQAERLDPDVSGTQAVRAELHFERFREARDLRDEGAMAFHRARVLEHDPSGDWARAIAGEFVLTIVSDPPGAQVHVFRAVDLSRLAERGEPRFVAVPLGGPGPIPPGVWALRVIEDRAPLARGDFVIELAGHGIENTVLVVSAREPVAFLDRLMSIDGAPVDDLWAIDNLGARAGTDEGAPQSKKFVFERNGAKLEVLGASLADLGVRAMTAADFAACADRPSVKATIVRDGQRLDVELPPATGVRATAAPIVPCAASLVGTTPLQKHGLPSDRYIALLTHPDREGRVLTFTPGVGSVERRVELFARGTAPSDFVFVDDVEGDFWIQEHEVTAAEYLEFLNDPATRAEIAASLLPTRYPRQGRAAAITEEYWERASDGSYAMPDEWSPDWPMLGISWNDAQAYARWRTERDRARGLRGEYALPTYEEYIRAGAGRLLFAYAWGTRYRAHWARTCFARPTAAPGRVMQFPIDQSVFGVFDLAGSAFEWLDAWYDSGRDQRWIGGSSWGHPDPGMASVTGGYGAYPDSSSGSVGMRLVLHLERGEQR